MDPQCAPTARHQDPEVAPRLSGLDHAERVALAGHREVRAVLASDLEEHA